MIVKTTVLLRIQHLKKCSRSITLIITAGLVNLIQEHQRIAYSRLLQCSRDTSRHCSHISLTMSADLSLIPYTAKADPYIFLMKGLCHRFRDRCFAGSRRTYKTENRALASGSQFAHCKKFHDTLLDILKTVMSLFQDFPCFLKIHGIFGFFIPWQIQQSLNIRAQHTAFCRTAVHALKPVDFLADLVPDFFGSLKLFEFIPVFFCRVSRIILSKLLSYQLKLFSQNILSLVLVHPGFEFMLQIVSDLKHLDLICQDCRKNFILFFQS